MNNAEWRHYAGLKNGPGFVLDPDERDSIATQFGVPAEQVERDHLISHLLAFLSRNFGDRIHFIGGTALARTHLPDGRLSEEWTAQLAGQTRLTVSATEALAIVRDAWREAVNAEEGNDKERRR